MKKDILVILKTAVSNGITQKRVCELLVISERRVQRWQTRDGNLSDCKPGPEKAPHALLPEEKAAVLKFAKEDEYADDSHRVLAAKAADKGLFYVSPSTVYNIMRAHSLTTDRTGRVCRAGNRTAPVRHEIDGPNQRWCWDITYLQTPSRSVNYFLFALLDEYSRKIVSWRFSLDMKHENAMVLLQAGLKNEGLDDIDVKLPDLINDRGSQMKARDFMKLCENLGINQQFARPRTPNDNPFIESFFSILKGYHRYPGLFENDICAITYITEFMSFYNNSRYHGEIGFVTPEQMHTGKDKKIINKRRIGMMASRQRRLTLNKNAKTKINVDKSLSIA
jgi:transposase InsO family protein